MSRELGGEFLFDASSGLLGTVSFPSPSVIGKELELFDPMFASRKTDGPVRTITMRLIDLNRSDIAGGSLVPRRLRRVGPDRNYGTAKSVGVMGSKPPRGLARASELPEPHCL